MAVCQVRAPAIKKLALAEIESGLILAADVKSKSGTLLMSHGQVVSDALLRRMKNVHLRIGVVEPILCEVPAPAEPQQRTAAFVGR